MFLFRKNKDLLDQYTKYLELCAETLEIFRKAIAYSFENGLNEHFEVLAGKVHAMESDADDIRRQIERTMYEQSLLPESREDLLDIIERIDMVPNCADHLATLLTLQRTPINPALKSEIMELLDLSIESFKYTKEAAVDCFLNMQKVKGLKILIDNNESLGDKLEHTMIKMVFSESIGVGEKIIQKDMINQIGDICNLCEHVMDRILICSIKRQL
ncbi:MAG: DUF47 family protein [Victivallales bacterium]